MTEKEFQESKEQLNVQPSDAFVLVADEKTRAEDALDAVVDRVLEAFVGVPEETRTAMADGTSRYMRPRPGAARMYPETDVPPTPVTDHLIATLKASLPETAESLTKRLIDQFSLNQKLAKQLIDSDYLALFEQISSTGKTPPSFVATALTETCKSLEREGIPVHCIPDEKILAIFRLVDQGTVAKEAIADLLRWQAKSPNADPGEGVRELDLRMLTERELEQVIERHIEKNKKLIEDRGPAAFSSLMGSVMSEVRGSTDPKTVTEKLKEKLAQAARK
jgi:glutamyl-tRNA(Gln) amidotransferase subunit E